MNVLHITGSTENEAIISFVNSRTCLQPNEFSIDGILESIKEYYQASKVQLMERNEKGLLVDPQTLNPTAKILKAPLTLEGTIEGYLLVENPKVNEDHLLLLALAAGSIYKEIVHAKDSKLIHELRRTQMDLEYINKTIENSGIGIWGIFDFDKPEPQMTANPKMLELLAYTGDPHDYKAIYQQWHSNVHPEYEQQIRDCLAVMIQGKHGEVTYPWKHPSKGYIYVRCGGTMGTAKSGTRFLSGYHSDVTEIILKEQETQKKLEFAILEAKMANEARATFLSRMSHDIRTPLNGIIGLLEIGEHHPDDRAMIDANRAKARMAANHLLSLVNDILNLNKLEDGKAVLAHEAFNIADLATEILTMIDTRATEEGLTLEHENCEEQLAYPYVYGSPLHVKQVLLNIMGNAIKYNKAGGKISCVTKMVAHNDKTVTYQVTVTDTGIGMSPEFQKKMFEPFAQERIDARSTYQGTGLGMTIAKSLVERMNGTLSVQSELGKGTTFVVTITFDIASGNDIPEKMTQVNLNLKGRHLLLVEDNELNMEIASMIFEDLGATTSKAVNGQEAVDIFNQNKPGTFDLILMDIMMPVMNGYDATRAIRALPHPDANKIPIVAMSANAFEEDRQKGFEAGMNGYLAKPINADEMQKTLTQVLQH